MFKLYFDNSHFLIYNILKVLKNTESSNFYTKWSAFFLLGTSLSKPDSFFLCIPWGTVDLILLVASVRVFESIFVKIEVPDLNSCCSRKGAKVQVYSISVNS